jgi:hypothetical protein
MTRVYVLAIPFIAWAMACASAPRPFSLKAPVSIDSDLQSVAVPCRSAPTKTDPRHVSCAPEEYFTPDIWDVSDNLVFRPIAEVWTFPASSEAENANSLDEVADSAWFTNRIGVRPMPVEELSRGGCSPEDFIHPESEPDGSWVIDQGKANGSSLGFRVTIRGRKYMFKADTDTPERPTAASVIGAAVYHAVGYNTSCEQIVYFRPALLSLKPGLKYKGNIGGEHDFDSAALDHVLSVATPRGGLVRFNASQWLPGKLLGPFRYVGTRDDDPNDAIAHENRRELRGGQVLAAWLDHTDARERNSMDVWLSDRPKDPDSSPGHVLHYYLDTSDCFGPAWPWDQLTRRLGYSYVFDWGDFGRDFVTLGIPRRPWDRVQRVPGYENFNYFDVANFVPDEWKNEYPNPAFDRTTERDAAWMARILARFTPRMVHALAEMGRFSRQDQTEYLGAVLEGRLERILERYLLRLSPMADVRIKGDELCGTDLAELRALRPADRFQYTARSVGGGWLQVNREPEGRICVDLAHVRSPSAYLRIAINDGVARGVLVAHLYDPGPQGSLMLVGLERPEEGEGS